MCCQLARHLLVRQGACAELVFKMAYFKEPILFLCGIIFMKFLSDAKPCGSGCWCFKTLVDCRGTGEVPMLKFSLQRLATELDLTENPSLSLIEMDFSAWPALQALYLGKLLLNYVNYYLAW